MARAFDDASLEYLEASSAPTLAAPFTMACWAYTDDATIDQVGMSIGTDGSNVRYWWLGFAGAVVGDPVRLRIESPSANRNADTATGYSTGTWHHLCAVEAAADNHAVFIDGGSKGTNLLSVTPAPSAPGIMDIARRAASSPDTYLSGRIAEAAVWDVALSDDEVALLAKGFSPLFIRPQNIISYWPLIRDNDNDRFGVANLTAFNTPTVADHPPTIIYPAGPFLSFLAAAAPAPIRVPDLSLLGVGQ